MLAIGVDSRLLELKPNKSPIRRHTETLQSLPASAFLAPRKQWAAVATVFGAMMKAVHPTVSPGSAICRNATESPNNASCFFSGEALLAKFDMAAIAGVSAAGTSVSRRGLSIFLITMCPLPTDSAVIRIRIEEFANGIVL